MCTRVRELGLACLCGLACANERTMDVLMGTRMHGQSEAKAGRVCSERSFLPAALQVPLLPGATQMARLLPWVLAAHDYH